MKIVDIEWKNIFSYGNKTEKIEFGDSAKLWLLSGVSGAGKTSLLTIPKLLLYGKTEGSDGKPFKVGAIANRINKHGWIRGTVVNGNDTYVIERTFSPQSIKVYKNGEDIDKAGTKNVQAVIDTEILDGMPYHIFANVMTLSLNNFKSFISMTPADKRAIIDKIFSLEVVNKVYELVKKDKKDVGNAINTTNNVIFQIDRTIKREQEQLESLTKIDKAPLIEKAEKIKEVLPKLAESHQQYTDLYKEQYQKFSEIQATENSISALVGKLNAEISQINNQIRLFNEDKCPTCGTPFSGEAFDDLRENLNKSLAEKQESLNTYREQQNELSVAKSTVTTNLSQIQTNINTIAAKSSELNADLRNIETTINTPDQYDAIEEIIRKNTEDRINFEKELDEKNRTMRYLSVMENMYSGDGIKQQMMNRYVPMLNDAVREALTELGFPYTLTFDGNFDPHLQHMSEDIDPQTLSCGEHKKVDLTVLCAILKMLKQKYPQINLVCLDETVSSLDSDSSSDIIKYLKKIADEMNLNIFVVSHTSLEETLFDTHLFVDKKSGFSELKYIK